MARPDIWRRLVARIPSCSESDSGYSDGGGGQGMAESVYDIEDSDDEGSGGRGNSFQKVRDIEKALCRVCI